MCVCVCLCVCVCVCVCVRNLQEKCQEQNMDLYSTFVDLTKAFDQVSRDGLWKIVSKFENPARFVNIIK